MCQIACNEGIAQLMIEGRQESCLTWLDQINNARHILRRLDSLYLKVRYRVEEDEVCPAEVVFPQMLDTSLASCPANRPDFSSASKCIAFGGVASYVGLGLEGEVIG